MKLKNACVLGLSLMLLLTGCDHKDTPDDDTTINDGGNTGDTTDKSNFDVDLPTEIPTFESDSVQIHYKRTDKKYAPWSLWLWSPGADGAKYDFNYCSGEFLVASYELSTFNIDLDADPTATLGFIVAKNPGSTWDAKDTDSDRFVDFSSLEKDDNNVYHVYIFQEDGNVYIDEHKKMIDKIEVLKFISTSSINCQTTNSISKYEIFENDVCIAEKELAGVKYFNYYFTEEHPFSFENSYKAKVTFTTGTVIIASVSMQNLYNQKVFNDAFYYDGELGAIYSETETTFKVWSPLSSKIILKVYNSGTPVSLDAAKGDDTVLHEVELTKGEKGVFSGTVAANLDGKYYTYTVYNGTYPNGKEIVDPYAKSCGVNGLRGMVVNFEKTNPTGWESINVHQYDRKQLTVWETHVADVTSSTTWTGTEANRKKFLGLVESGTTYTENDVTVKTGFDHIKELGVNAVQLVPIFDQANNEVNPTFNWGYNPLNYNCLEGSYSSDPYDGYARIKEFKEVVAKFNEAGINIIMDVVYNHTNSVGGTNFDVLMPGYYYRYDGTGVLYNGSGCGNETASELSMMRKFMIDSVCFWAEEYKLGGFRFDLMGLHDIETMNQLTAAAKAINPSITIYGEPWTGGTSGLNYSKQAVQNNGNQFVGYGQFNDRMRDELVKGGMSAATEKSWISNTSSNTTNMSNLKAGIVGTTKNAALEIADPDKTVNYVTCHDNYTLFDRFKAAGISDYDTVKKMAMLANSVVFTSQGTTFMLAGEEFLRTKQGNNNSYNASYKVNELDYSLKVKNLDMFANYQKLIEMKINFDALHFDKNEAANIVINTKDSNNVITYTLTGEYREVMIIHSNGVNASNRSSIDLTGYTLYLDTLGILSGELGSVQLQAFQTIVAFKTVTE